MMIPELFRTPLFVQLVYVALVIAWQLVGASMAAMGMQAPGPVASFSIAAQALVVAVLFVVALRRSPAIFTLLSLLSGFAAGSSIHHTLTADPTLWLSDATRYVSIAINSVGLLAATLVVVAFGRHLRARTRKRNVESESGRAS